MDVLSKEYHVADICAMMHVSRSGYYKWKGRKPSRCSLTRKETVGMVRKVHEEHSVHGYRWIAAYIRINMHTDISDSHVYKCCRHLGLQAQTRHKPHRRPRKVKDRYANLIFSTWNTVDRPRQVIVSDMTAFHISYMYIEVTFYFDVFTKEMLSYRMAERRGDRLQYMGGLEDVVSLLKGNTEPTILHTDQGSVYASVAYNELIRETMIVRSMSRAGKPTDNPVNESLNGWMKEELYADFHIGKCSSREQVADVLKNYMKYYNTMRPCYAVGYNTPAGYKKLYDDNKIEHKDTFSTRKLSTLPKFVQKRKHSTENVDNTQR